MERLVSGTILLCMGIFCGLFSIVNIQMLIAGGQPASLFWVYSIAMSLNAILFFIGSVLSWDAFKKGF